MPPTNILSVDALLTSAQVNGLWTRAFVGLNITSGTAANATSGHVPMLRNPKTITAPSVGSGLSGMYLTGCRMYSTAGSGNLFCGLEYNMGTLTVSGNSYVDGVTMPTKIVKGVSIQTVAQLPVVYVSTALTATTPVLTITYKNQAGTGSRTCTMTLPTSPAVNSCFLMTPHLQAGDTGVQDITNVSISTGSAGVISIMGMLILAQSTSSANMGSLSPLSTNQPVWLVEPAETIAFYRSSSASGTMWGLLSGVAETV